jgi:Ca-activated chloride channel family protein
MSASRRERTSALPVEVWLAVCAVLGLFGAASAAQSVFKARLDLVQVTVSVTDQEGRLVTGLTKDDFQVWEEGVEQQVVQFTDERLPVSVGILLDASDSMRGQAIVDARGALNRFVGELLWPDDEVFVATFNHLPRLASRWKRPPTSLANVLRDLRPTGGTAIYDSLAETSALFDRRQHLRAAFVLISDGADTASDRTLHQALDVIRRNDAFVYAVAIDSPDARASTRVNPEALREITSMTGGYTEIVRHAADLAPATQRIADELNKQYTLGYSSTRPPDGSWRTLRVRVRRPDHFVRARRGYYATQ